MGGTGRRYGGLDRFRPAAVALVVAIHTGPLLSVSPAANDLLTDILGRLAVPFFFMVTGFFLLPRLEDQGPVALLPLLKKTGLLYALSILLYLPLQIVNGFFSGLTFGELARTLLVTGFYYHLWYFPAVMLGACLVGLLTWSLPRLALPLCVLFYLLGLPGDSYYGLTAALPGVPGLLRQPAGLPGADQKRPVLRPPLPAAGGTAIHPAAAPCPGVGLTRRPGPAGGRGDGRPRPGLAQE